MAPFWGTPHWYGERRLQDRFRTYEKYLNLGETRIAKKVNSFSIIFTNISNLLKYQSFQSFISFAASTITLCPMYRRSIKDYWSETIPSSARNPNDIKGKKRFRRFRITAYFLKGSLLIITITWKDKSLKKNSELKRTHKGIQGW